MKKAYIPARVLIPFMGNTLLYMILHDGKEYPTFYREWDKRDGQENAAGSLTFTAKDISNLITEMRKSAVLFREPYIVDPGVPEAYESRKDLSPKPMSDADIALVKEDLGLQG